MTADFCGRFLGKVWDRFQDVFLYGPKRSGIDEQEVGVCFFVFCLRANATRRGVVKKGIDRVIFFFFSTVRDAKVQCLA